MPRRIVVDPTPEAGQDPAPGDVDGPDRQSRARPPPRSADGPRRAVCQKACQVGGSELAPDLVGRPAEQAPLVLGLEQGRGRRVVGRLGLEELLDAGGTRCRAAGTAGG